MSDQLSATTPTPEAETLTRRTFLFRAVLLGTASVAGSSLLTACWPFGDDEEDDADLTPTPSGEDVTPTLEETPEPEPTPTPDATPTPEAPPDEPQTGGVLRVALAADPYSLHPNADESVINWTVMSQIYNALMEVDHNFEPVPVLAESVDVAEDGTAYTFTIHDDVPFHNGEILTADDVAYSHEWMRQPENGAARSFYYERVEEIIAEDELTVVFQMSSPDGTLLRRAASTFIINAAFHEEFGPEGQSLQPIGTGPFTLDSWQRGVSLTLERFDDYFAGPALMDGIRFQVIGDGASRRSAVASGDVDVAWDLPLDDSLELLESSGVLSVESVNLDCTHIALNNAHPVLSNATVRRAMQHAIDPGALIDAIYQGAATSATSYLSPAVEEWHEEQFPPDRQMIDVANELLDSAGWVPGDDGIRERDGERISFTCIAPENPDLRQDAAELVADMLGEIGVEMEIETAPLSETLNEMRAGERDAAIFNWTYGGWLGEPDGRTTLLTGAFNNFSQFSSIQVDNLLMQGVSEIDQEARVAIYRSIQQHIAEQSPFLFLVFPHSWYHFSERVQGVPETARWGARLMRLTTDFWIWER